MKLDNTYTESLRHIVVGGRHTDMNQVIIEWQKLEIKRLEQGISCHISQLIDGGTKEDSVIIIGLKELLK